MTVKKDAVRKRRTIPGRSRVVKAVMDVPKEQEEILESKNRMLSNFEKRELILAHAAMHRKKTRDPLQVVSLYAGVAITSLVVILGWFYAFSPSILKAVKSPFASADNFFIKTDELKNLAGDAKKQSEESDLGRMLKQTTGELDRISEQAEKERAILDRLAESVSSTVKTESLGGFSNTVPIITSTKAIKKVTSTSAFE